MKQLMSLRDEKSAQIRRSFKCRRISLKNTKVPDRVIMKIKCILTLETLWIPATVLLNLILLLCTINTAQNTSVHRTNVSAELHKKAVLLSEFRDIHQTDHIHKVEWKKHENQTSHKVLFHIVSNNTHYYAPYQGRINYHFYNQSLIFYEVQKKDEGVYEAILEYKNGTIVDQIITLWVKTPPEIHTNGNGSHWTLTCKYTSEGIILRKWLQNGQPLSPNNRYVFREENRTLLLNNMTVEDCGTYTCLVTDDMIRKEAHIHLTGENTPMCAEIIISAATLKYRYLALAAFAALILIAFAILCLKKCYLGHRKKNQTTQDHHVYEMIGELKEETHSSSVYTPVAGSQFPSFSSPSQTQQNEVIYSYIGHPQPKILNP